MWNTGTCVQSLAFLFLLALICSVCHGGHSQQQHGAGDCITISREILLSLRTSAEGEVPTNIPAELFVLHHMDKAPKRRPSQRKRGRRGGIRRKMKTLGLDNRRQLPPLPSIFLSNVQSLKRKVDEMEIWAKFKQEIKEACLLAITEMWLNENDLDSDLALTGFGCPIRLDHSSEDRNSLNSIVKVCSKIIGVQQSDLNALWEKRVVQKAKGLIDQHDHVLSSEFTLLLSGRRYQAPPRKTNHYAKSFIPSAIRLLNAQ
ncbi:hypothetical protein SKAU_G00410590 [Synaphobranchus kaupii]|uniref:Uncharacterized protein n=1 Tax=Synaphobranchus kaupii TaxID=118154 RepID=A0A9Q1E7N6_SYNKA|nr:hypothetical protein SKAU_G00410590 [Synaphobranchus kaupii]